MGEPTTSAPDRRRDAGLARQKRPESIHQVDEVPLNLSGKVQEFRVRLRLHRRGGELPVRR